MNKTVVFAAVGLLSALSTGSAIAAGISCEPSDNGYLCEAWPRGEHYRYEWNVSGGVRISTAPVGSTPRLSLACNGKFSARVTVTVVAPAGYIETAMEPLSACRSSEASLAVTNKPSINPSARSETLLLARGL